MLAPYVSVAVQVWDGLPIPLLVLSGSLVWLLMYIGSRRSVERLLRVGAGRCTVLWRAWRRRPPAPPRRAERHRVDTGPARPGRDPAPAAPTPAAGATDAGAAARRCRMDLAATRSGLELTVELPGVEEKDVAIQLADDLLTISGHVSFEPDREDKNYRLTERDFGSFSRSIALPEGVAPDKIRAVLNRGLLKVTIPNPAKPEPRTIQVQGEPLHLAETADGYELTVDMPGLTEGDIEVLVNNGALTVRAERTAGPDIQGALAARDRPRLARTVELPPQVDADQISAVLGNGVLKVTMPRPAHAGLRKVDVRAAA